MCCLSLGSVAKRERLNFYNTKQGGWLTRAARLLQGDRAHTILLMQTGPAKASRTFMDYETVTLAMDGEPGRHSCLQ
jgi:hypothetical protein